MDIHIDFLKADSVRNAQPAFTHAPGFDFEKFYTDVIKPYINEDLKEQGKMDICQILDLCEVEGTYGVELGNQTEGDPSPAFPSWSKRCSTPQALILDELSPEEHTVYSLQEDTGYPTPAVLEKASQWSSPMHAVCHDYRT
jgi:hypothetical protein